MPDDLGDSICQRGADDASGTAGWLVIAKAFKSMAPPPARSILFLAATAEQKGLLGSDYFAHFPSVPIKSIVADINMDGASVFTGLTTSFALGAPDSSLDAVVARNAEVYGAMGGDPLPRSVGRHESAIEFERRSRIQANRLTGGRRYRAGCAASQGEALGIFSARIFGPGNE